MNQQQQIVKYDKNEGDFVQYQRTEPKHIDGKRFNRHDRRKSNANAPTGYLERKNITTMIFIRRMQKKYKFLGPVVSILKMMEEHPKDWNTQPDIYKLFNNLEHNLMAMVWLYTEIVPNKKYMGVFADLRIAAMKMRQRNRIKSTTAQETKI